VLTSDLAELRRIVEGDDDELDSLDEMDMDEMEHMGEMDDFYGDEDEEDEFDENFDDDDDGNDDDMDENDGFGDGYDDVDEDEQVWTSPAEFAGVDLITPRRSYRGAKNMETVKDCMSRARLHSKGTKSADSKATSLGHGRTKSVQGAMMETSSSGTKIPVDWKEFGKATVM
jgi:hypothetical protein